MKAAPGEAAMQHKNSKPTVQQLTWTAIAIASLALAPWHSGRAADSFPQVSPEGLQLQKDTALRAVYLKPGATLAPYKRVAILDCLVEFAKDFQRDYNEDQPMEGQISKEEMAKITTALAAEFKQVFTQELQANGGYPVVDSAAPDVLVVRPAIINLVVNAPNLQTPDMNATVVSSAGQMTLYVELYDSMTNTLLARVIDPESDNDPVGEVADAVTNKSAADRILRRWADILRKHLDAVQAQSQAGSPASPAAQ
jgi:hypothetical protein